MTTTLNRVNKLLLFLEESSSVNLVVKFSVSSSKSTINTEKKESSNDLLIYSQCNDIKRVLYTTSEIKSRVKELGRQISSDYKNKDLVAVGLLRGAFMFFSDLVQQITIPLQIDFMILTSYSGTNTTGSVKVVKDMTLDPKNKHILIIEDLIDTGTTLSWLEKHLQLKQCKSVKLCTFLNKTARRTKEVSVDYIGYSCPDEFIVGYGMDYKQLYRNLPFVAILKEEIFS